MTWTRIILRSAPFLWLGFVLAISFMEAPLKFTAPGITTELGLGIGRVVFFALNKIELVLCISLGFALLSSHRKKDKRAIVFFLIPAVVLFLETIWLLPALDQRAVTLLDTGALDPSYHHSLYIVLESIKIVGLFIFGFKEVKE